MLYVSNGFLIFVYHMNMLLRVKKNYVYFYISAKVFILYGSFNKNMGIIFIPMRKLLKFWLGFVIYVIYVREFME